jgi:hypothetical protein
LDPYKGSPTKLARMLHVLKWSLVCGIVAVVLLIIFLPFSNRNKSDTEIKHSDESVVDQPTAIPGKPDTNAKANNMPENLICLGAYMDNFDKQFGKPVEKNGAYDYPDGAPSVEYTFADKRQAIFIDLNFEEKNINNHPIYPIRTQKDVDSKIIDFLPADAELVESVAYQDEKSSYPSQYIRIYRLYQSQWLKDNLGGTAADKSTYLDDGIFWVIIDKTEKGYIGASIGVNSTDWDDTNEQIAKRNGRTKIAMPE